MAPPKKQYGLILKGKKSASALVKSKLSFFDDDDYEEQNEKSAVEAEIKKAAEKKKVMKQTQLDIQRALEQDSSIYDYDGVYDEMKKEKEEIVQSKKRSRIKKAKIYGGSAKNSRKAKPTYGKTPRKKSA